MKIPVKAKKLNADMISLSGHKIYAPKGIGALYVKKGVHIPPFMLGEDRKKVFVRVLSQCRSYAVSVRR